MYAVIKTGGKQYKVAENDKLTVEKLDFDAGKVIELNEVLLLSDGKAVTTGQPLVEGARVMAEVVEQTRGDTIIIFKKKRRQGYKRRNGHRQKFTVLRVTEILAKGAKATAKSDEKVAEANAAAKAEKKAAKTTSGKTAAKKAAPKAAAPKTAAKKPAAKKPAAKKAAPKAEAKTAAKKPAAKKPAEKKPAAKKPAAKKSTKKES